MHDHDDDDGGGGGVAALREQVLVAAGGLRAVGKGATGLLQGATEAVSMLGQNLGSMILEEAAALDVPEGKGGKQQELQDEAVAAAAGGGIATRVRPSMRRGGGQQPSAGAGGGGVVEGVVGGIVGGLGALAGVGSSASQQSGGEGGLRLYRREGEGEGADAGAGAAAPSSSSSSSLLGSASERLWGFVEQQYDGDTLQQQQPSPQQPQQQQQGPLPAPPSQLLSGLITGIGGFLASGVERAASAMADGGDEEDEEGLPLGERLRRKAAREAKAEAEAGKGGEPPLRLYRREDGGDGGANGGGR